MSKWSSHNKNRNYAIFNYFLVTLSQQCCRVPSSGTTLLYAVGLRRTGYSFALTNQKKDQQSALFFLLSLIDQPFLLVESRVVLQIVVNFTSQCGYFCFLHKKKYIKLNFKVKQSKKNLQKYYHLSSLHHLIYVSYAQTSAMPENVN